MKKTTPKSKSRKWTIKIMRKYLDDKLHIYQQSNTSNWYARFYTEGKYKVRSLKETRFEIAKEIAHEWYFELRGKQKSGTPVHGLKFKDVIQDYLNYQNVLVKGGEMSESSAKDYQRRLSGGISYFGDLYLQEITLHKLNEYKEKRFTDDGVKHTTIKHDFNTIRQVLKYCVLRKHIQSLPEFPKKSKKDIPSPRPYFELDEWKLLQKISQDRIKRSRGSRQKYEREQLHDFMIFMVHTGMRVDEVLRTTFGNVKTYTKKDKTKELRININGKTGIRKVRGMIGSVRAYERLKKRNDKHNPTDFLFPQNHRDGLNALLKETGLKQDSQSRTRNAKSFRSTYIMYRLLAKQPIKAVAVNCGTSSNVIDSYYARFITIDMYDDSFTDLPE